jgi:uncharacterized flavoprotein (TIGR03862 family)
VGADAVVLAMGGASWPATGSDGAWVGWLSAEGVDVRELRPANCGFLVHWTAAFTEKFAGHPLKDVSLRFGAQGGRGDVVITDDGVEGGPVYALSAPLREAVTREGVARPTIDLRPGMTLDELEARLTRRRARDSISSWLRRAGFAPVTIGLLREATGNELPVEPAAMAAVVKAAPLTLVGTQAIDRAISTAGGVSFDEIDESYMLRRRPGTFVAGEMLDWEAPTGGYLLQATFSTAVAAANGALAWLAR